MSAWDDVLSNALVGTERKLFRVERGDVRDLPRIMDLMLRIGVTRILLARAIVLTRIRTRFRVISETGRTGLAAPQRLGDERIGQHQPRLRHVADRQQHFGGFARFGIVAPELRGIALEPD